MNNYWCHILKHLQTNPPSCQFFSRRCSPKGYLDSRWYLDAYLSMDFIVQMKLPICLVLRSKFQALGRPSFVKLPGFACAQPWSPKSAPVLGRCSLCCCGMQKLVQILAMWERFLWQGCVKGSKQGNIKKSVWDRKLANWFSRYWCFTTLG